jgi:hypothetical protein
LAIGRQKLFRRPTIVVLMLRCESAFGVGDLFCKAVAERRPTAVACAVDLLVATRV